MKKSILQLYVLLICLGFLMIIQPQTLFGYDGIDVPSSAVDALNVILVLGTLAAFETGFLDEMYDKDGMFNIIPLYLKKIIGMYMLFGIASMMHGLFGSGYYFNDVISIQAPITIIDISVLVTAGASLYWAGGLAYTIMIQSTISIGSFCIRILKKLNLFEIEDDKEAEEEEE